MDVNKLYYTFCLELYFVIRVVLLLSLFMSFSAKKYVFAPNYIYALVLLRTEQSELFFRGANALAKRLE